MKWIRVDRYAQKTECGRYSVAAYGLGNGEFRYEAWRMRAHQDGPHRFRPCFETPEAARNYCEQYNNGNNLE